MASISELQSRIAKLKAARASGAARISYGERMVEYRSVEEITAAIAADERELASLQGQSAVRGFYMNSDKGL
ncbi:MAG: hypothetical protein WD073_04170 [Xanthobacteraceae bacterium]